MSDRLSPREPVPSQPPGEPANPLSLPQATVLPDDLSARLRDLSANRMLFVDANGTAHETKESILKQGNPLVSFRKQLDGSFRVYSGLPPANLTHCGSGAVPNLDVLKTAPDIEAPVVLNSGDWIALTAYLPVRIPSSRKADPLSAAEKLGELIASGSIGDTIILGRFAVHECPRHVSRAHITVKILERFEVSSTKVQLRVLAIPGMQGTQPLYEVKPDGQLEEIIGSKALPAGGMIQVGEEGERFTLPHPKDSLSEASLSFHRSLLVGDMSASQSVMSLFGKDGLKKVQFDALRKYLTSALTMIREGQAAEASKHLRTQSKELAVAGFTLRENTQITLARLTHEDVERSLTEAARPPWFTLEDKLIALNVGELAPGLEPSTDAERELLATWEKNIALIYAEGYVRALQELNDGAISDYTPLLGGKKRLNRDADVALFFKRHGIDLSDGLFTGQHGVRRAALRHVQGIQTKEQEDTFKAAILAAPLKTPVNLLNQVSISRTEAGYVVTPIGENFGTYVMTAHGPAKKLRETATLQGGDQLFLESRSFTLPLFTNE
jgi:hypothetical protein